MIDKDWSVVIGTRSVVEGKIKEVENALLRRDMLDTSKCYLLDCGSELFIWTGRNTSLDLLVECTPNVLFGLRVSQLKIITFIYWLIECNPNVCL